MEHINRFKILFTAILAALTALWGWLGWMVVIWVGLMVLDYISGTWAASHSGTWASKAARDGIAHKGGMVFVVLVAAAADGILGFLLDQVPVIALPFDYSVVICPIVLAWYMITELGSITENAIKLGAPVPPWLLKIFALSKDAVDAAGDKLTGGNNSDA